MGVFYDVEETRCFVCGRKVPKSDVLELRHVQSYLFVCSWRCLLELAPQHEEQEARDADRD